MDSATRKEVLTSSTRGSRTNRDLAGLLSTTGLVTIGYTLISLFFSCLPLKLVDPEWQLRAAGSFAASGPSLLVGSLLICLARAFDGTSQHLAGRVKLLRRLCTWTAILYLLLIPMQVHAGVRLLQQKSGEEAQLQAQWMKFRSQIQGTNSEEELRTLLSSLPQPAQLPSKLDVPLAVLKEQILTNADSRFRALKYQTEAARSQRWQNFISEAANTCLKTLLVAIGFAAFAQVRPGDPTLLNQGLVLIGKGSRRKGSSNGQAKAGRLSGNRTSQ